MPLAASCSAGSEPNRSPRATQTNFTVITVADDGAASKAIAEYFRCKLEETVPDVALVATTEEEFGNTMREAERQLFATTATGSRIWVKLDGTSAVSAHGNGAGSVTGAFIAACK